MSFQELDDVTEALNEVGIVVGEYKQNIGYDIEFAGTEDEFKIALEMMLMTTDYYKQDEDWFPGDPGDCGEMDYYIMNNDVEFCINYEDMLMSDLV